MFWSRVDEAKNEVDDSFYEVSQSKTNSSTPSHRSTHKGSYDESFEVSKILNDLSEYLFDLFDANCMEEYKRIEDFEAKAMLAFQDSFATEEYTFEQESLHKEFMNLFEELIHKFLIAEGITNERLYEILRKHTSDQVLKSRKESNAALSELSHEIADVIHYYTTFEIWATNMKDQAKFNSTAFKGFTENILLIQNEYNLNVNKLRDDYSSDSKFGNDRDDSEEKYSKRSL